MSHKKGAKAKVEQSAINYSQASTSTYYAGSTTQADQDAQETSSVYTYNSAMDAQKFIKWVGERAYNTLSEVYYLPADDNEWTRLQHVALSIAMGGLYAEPEVVRSILAPQSSSKSILDLGCGTGIWSSEMGTKFPHCEVVGVDLAPVPENGCPPNCRFEIDDINLGLAHFEGQFDVVHARLIGGGMKDFRATMTEVEKTLKPGGIVLWFDVDYDMYARDRHVYMPFATEEEPDQGSWLQRMGYEMRRCAVLSGKSDIYGMSDALDAGLWNRELLDPTTCKAASLYLPIGPWPEDDDGPEKQMAKYVGALMRQDLMSAHRAGHAVMKRAGFSEERVQDWSGRADKEMMNLSRPMWMRMRLAWGRRRSAEGGPAPPIPESPNVLQSDSTEPAHLYPHYYVYNTPEEALHDRELRDRGKDLPVPPLPGAPS